MVASTVYMNHYPYFSSASDREAVTADFTASIWELAGPTNKLGMAVDLTLKTLGFDSMNPPEPSAMLLVGSKKEISQGNFQLRRSIGRIADRAMDSDLPRGNCSRSGIEDTLDGLVHNAIPELLDKPYATIKTAGHVLATFGENCNDDGCGLMLGHRAGWSSRNFESMNKFDSLPEDIRKRWCLPSAIQADVPPKETSETLRIVRNQARRWLLSHAEQLRDAGGFDDAMYKEYEDACASFALAVEDIKSVLERRIGKPFDQLIFPEDFINDLVDKQLAQIQQSS